MSEQVLERSSREMHFAHTDAVSSAEEDPRHRSTADSTRIIADTHAHLEDPAFADDLDMVLARAREAGVDRILAVGSDLESSRRTVRIAGQFREVYAAVGIHPYRASRFAEECTALEELLAEQKLVAIGEIGLDYVRAEVSREQQLFAFRRQLTWAAYRQLPVSVHNRGADEDVLLEVTRSGVTAIFHCFSATVDVARRALAEGHYVSFAGNLTFPKAGELRQVAADIPLDRLLIETDSPVLAPQPYRGRRNEPSYIRTTAQILATIHGLSIDALSSILSKNADRLFSWRTL